MTVTIVETRAQACAITGGVDTHADVHVAAALDPLGGLLGVQEFPASPAGYARLVEWLGGFGTVCLVGIEGTGSYGAGLARYVTAAGVRVVEVDRSDRQDLWVPKTCVTWADALESAALPSLPQLLAGKRPVLDQLVLIDLHRHARTLLPRHGSHCRNQRLRARLRLVTASLPIRRPQVQPD